MAKFLLLNTVWVGNSKRFAGEVIDTTQESLSPLQAAGATLVPTTTASATNLNSLAASLRLAGRSQEYIDGVVLASVLGARGQGIIPISVHDFRITDANNNVGATAANGGLLASDTAPVLAASSKMPTITWATGSVIVLSTQKAVPPDFDPTQDASLDLFVLSGTTNAFNVGIQVIWDGTAAVSYTAADTASATLHKLSTPLLASDMPAAGPNNVSIMLTPPAHATDTFVLAGARITYGRKIA